MYAAHFGLTERPFSLAPDPRYLYLSDAHREALAHLLYGVGEGGSFVQLTGEVGTGKTTVCRALLEQLPADVDVAMIFNPQLTSLELLAAVGDELRVPYAAPPARAPPRRCGRRDDLQSAAHLPRAARGGVRRAPGAVPGWDHQPEDPRRRPVPRAARRPCAETPDRAHHRRSPEPEGAGARRDPPADESGDDQGKAPAGDPHRPARAG